MASKQDDNADMDGSNVMKVLTKNELERLTEVFKMYETGVREAAIRPLDLAQAMKKLGLNPTETEIQDLINEVEMNGYIYYPEFCRIIMRKMREDDEENFHQELYRTFVGPKWTQNEPAELYNVHKEFLTFDQFKMVMTNLPDYVSESQAEEIFRIADKDGNGYISYTEFKRMCVVPKAESIPDKPFDTEDKPNGAGPPRDHAEKLFEKAKNGKAKNATIGAKVDTVVTAK